MAKAKHNTAARSATDVAQSQVNIRPTDADRLMITQAVTRACDICKKMSVPVGDNHRLDLSMDLAACHLNGNPLDFQKLLAFDDFSFMHDISGIMRHLDRMTGKLRDCFSPRASA